MGLVNISLAMQSFSYLFFRFYFVRIKNRTDCKNTIRELFEKCVSIRRNRNIRNLLWRHGDKEGTHFCWEPKQSIYFRPNCQRCFFLSTKCPLSLTIKTNCHWRDLKVKFGRLSTIRANRHWLLKLGVTDEKILKIALFWICTIFFPVFVPRSLCILTQLKIHHIYCRYKREVEWVSVFSH